MSPFKLFLVCAIGTMLVAAAGFVALHLAEDQETEHRQQQAVAFLEKRVGVYDQMMAACQTAIDARDALLLNCDTPKGTKLITPKQSDCEKALTATIEARDSAEDSCEEQVQAVRKQCTCSVYISDRDSYYQNSVRCEEKLDDAEKRLGALDDEVAVTSYWKNSWQSCEDALSTCYDSCN